MEKFEQQVEYFQGIAWQEESAVGAPCSIGVALLNGEAMNIFFSTVKLKTKRLKLDLSRKSIFTKSGI